MIVPRTILIMLKDHHPSKEAEEMVVHWIHNSRASSSFVLVETAQDMRKTKKEYFFTDLPCLIVEPVKLKRKYSMRRWPHYYGDDIEKMAYEVQKRYRK